jgi:hypothetical protein
MSALGSKKLEKIYQNLKLIDSEDMNRRYEIERPEQELIAKFLPSNCSVLEFGGSSGTTSLIIDRIMKNPNQHVLVEPSINSVNYIIHNVIKKYDAKFQIAHGFVGRDRTTHEELWSECKNCKMWDLIELENLVKCKFDVLIIDCEGAFYNILNEIPEILDSVKLIIIEMDGSGDTNENIKQKLLKNKFELVHTQTHPYFNIGMEGHEIFSEISDVNDLKKLKINPNIIGFHEVYVKF